MSSGDRNLCRHCAFPIVWLESIAQWWHIAGPLKYRGCRDAAGHLTGAGVAEPKETP